MGGELWWRRGGHEAFWGFTHSFYVTAPWEQVQG